MVTFLLCIAALIVGYLVYGTFVEKVFSPNEANRTPAMANPDGIDYVPISKPKAFLIQLSVSIYIDSRYESKLLRYFISCIWYPYVFWLINSLTLVHGFPKALLRDKNRKATWTSPDRGIQ